MKRLQAVFPLALLLAGGCLEEDKPLLCASDDDCETGRRCEVVSGLCVPSIEPPSFPMGGISGAFECLLPTPSVGPGGRPPGIASVVLRPPERDASCIGGPVGEIMGLQAGCVVTREVQARTRGQGDDPAFWVLRFEQAGSDFTNPDVRFAIYVRVDSAQVGALEVPVQATAQYRERCTKNDESRLELRYVSTQGTLQIDAVGDDRIEGRFDLDLAPLSAGADFGAECTLPRPCPAGDCTLVEQSTSRCATGVCVPDPREPDPVYGFCSGECESHRDCGFDRETAPDAYCFIPPGRPFGQCLRLCDPDQDTCAGSTTCRPSADFDDFPGGGGPARCLDECLGTASAPAPAGCRDPGADAGVPPDSGRPRDAGPADGGPVDAGPRDTGPVDTGPGGGSPLGTACGPGAACPNGWFCAQAAAGPLRMMGHCSRTCTGDGECQQDYTGPGTARCRPAVRNIQTQSVVNPACMVECGADFGGNDMCPHAMQCGDIFDNTTGMPPADGRNDVCTE